MFIFSDEIVDRNYGTTVQTYCISSDRAASAILCGREWL